MEDFKTAVRQRTGNCFKAQATALKHFKAVPVRWRTAASERPPAKWKILI
jgi:hypothetical protein